MQKAFENLNQRGIDFDFHDYKKAGITSEKIQEWFLVQPWEKFINRQGQTWRKLSELEKESVISPAGAIKIMRDKPSLIKRPILELEGELIIGLDPEVYK